MRSIIALMFVLVTAPSAVDAACGSCAAERVTAANASKLLFGGSDASGGIDDWYLTNGKVQAIVDDIGPAETGVPGVTVDKTSSNAVETGGTLIDVGMNGKNNDQLPQSFNVGGLSLANIFIFRQGDEVPWGLPAGHNPCVAPADTNCPLDPADVDCAAITVYGVMLGSCTPSSTICSTRANPTMLVRTTYKACNGRTSLDLRTEVWNQSGATQQLPIFDVLLWVSRAITAFAPDKGRGFSGPTLDLNDTGAILSAFTSAPYFAAPGNLSKLDGVLSRGKPTDAISYGYYSRGVSIDSNGGAASGTVTPLIDAFTMTSLQSNLVSVATASLGISVANDQSAIYDRTLVVAARNDAAAVLGDAKNPESILAQTSLPRGTMSGQVKGAKQEGTITFIRTAGSDLSASGAGFAALNNGVLSEVRTKSTFKGVQLPEGTYTLRAVFPGRDDVVVEGVAVAAGANTVAPTITLADNGTLQVEVRDATTNKGVPAKISLSPSPSMGRDFASFTFDTRTGVCSNNLNTVCSSNANCGGGNTCFRTCSNVEPQPCGTGCAGGFICSGGRCRNHGCDTDDDCDADYLCKADTTNNLPESYSGGAGQLHVIYTDKKGKIKADLRPGTYTVSVSRGLEYTIQKLDSVTIAPKATTKGGIVSLQRVVDTSGYMSADFHIHSSRSFDSSAPLEPRVRTFAGEGLEVMVSTDHDINTDLSPAIKKMGMNAFVTTIIGTEVTTSVPRPPYIANSWGHINVWPSVFDPNQRRSGSIEDESVSLNVILDRMRGTSNNICVGGKENGRACPPSACASPGVCTDVGDQVVQLNHPRAGLSGIVNIGMFNNIAYDPSKALNNCAHYPVLCPSSQCTLGTNDGTSCTTDAQCTGGGKCGCAGGSVPTTANGCNDILRDRNVIPQATRCTTAGCGGGFENPNGTRNVDFDLMEIDNGGSAGSFGGLRRVRRDWLSLLNQGVMVGKPGSQHPLWGSGVSDSHRLVAELPGYSRTYVGAGDLQSTGSIDIKSFNLQVLAGNMTASSGPYVEFTVDNGGTPVKMGQTLSGTGSVNLNISVQAAPWVPVDEVRILKNGCVIQCFNSTTTPAVAANPADPYDQGTSGVLRFDETVADTVSSDSYYIVEASPDLPTPGTNPDVDPVVNSVAAGTFPYGFTNPIFVDTNGGGYTGITLPGGSGEPVCPALPASCSAGATVASVAPSTLYASEPASTPRGLLARFFDLWASPAVAAHDDGPVPENEDERIRQHEEKLRKSSSEYYPWYRLQLPTPRPEDVRSVPSTEGK